MPKQSPIVGTNQSPFVGSTDTCRTLGIHPATLLRWIKVGKIVPAHKMPGDNGAYLFNRADVDRLAAERAEQSA